MVPEPQSVHSTRLSYANAMRRGNSGRSGPSRATNFSVWDSEEDDVDIAGIVDNTSIKA
jgi:hypothetical protein